MSAAHNEADEENRDGAPEEEWQAADNIWLNYLREAQEAVDQILDGEAIGQPEVLIRTRAYLAASAMMVTSERKWKPLDAMEALDLIDPANNMAETDLTGLVRTLLRDITPSAAPETPTPAPTTTTPAWDALKASIKPAQDELAAQDAAGADLDSNSQALADLRAAMIPVAGYSPVNFLELAEKASIFADGMWSHVPDREGVLRRDEENLGLTAADEAMLASGGPDACFIKWLVKRDRLTPSLSAYDDDTPEDEAAWSRWDYLSGLLYEAPASGLVGAFAKVRALLHTEIGPFVTHNPMGARETLAQVYAALATGYVAATGADCPLQQAAA